MDQSTSAQCVPCPLQPELAVRYPAELLVDHGEELVHGFQVAVAELEEEVGDLPAVTGGGRRRRVHKALGLGRLRHLRAPP